MERPASARRTRPRPAVHRYAIDLMGFELGPHVNVFQNLFRETVELHRVFVRAWCNQASAFQPDISNLAAARPRYPMTPDAKRIDRMSRPSAGTTEAERIGDSKSHMGFCEHCQGQRFDRAQVLRVLRATRQRLRESRRGRVDQALALAIEAVRKLEIPHLESVDEPIDGEQVH